MANLDGEPGTGGTSPSGVSGRSGAGTSAGPGSAEDPGRRYAGRKTGPKPGFTLDDAVDVAVAMGMDRCTLAGVAKRLGVSTPALYRVIDSHEQLIDASIRRAAGSLRTPDAALAWQDQLRHCANGLWGTLETYPGLSITILTHPGSHVHVQEYLGDLRRNLAATGFPGDGQRIDFALDFIGDTVIMTHLAVSEMRRTRDCGRTGLDIARAAFAGAPSEPVFAPEESWTQRGWLEPKIEFIVAGLAAGIPGKLPPPPPRLPVSPSNG